MTVHRFSCSHSNIGTFVGLNPIAETTFPPVFGHRLNAKVAKLGDRILLDVEVSGIPDPAVTWYKDERPIDAAILSAFKVHSQGNCHTLIIEKGTRGPSAEEQRRLMRYRAALTFDVISVGQSDAGKFMVKAVNDAGEAQSIADLVIGEPIAEPMLKPAIQVDTEHIEQTNVSRYARSRTFDAYKRNVLVSFELAVVSL